MVEKIKFFPKSEVWKPSPNVIFKTHFKLGFINIVLWLANSKTLTPRSKFILSKMNKDLDKYYFIIVSIGEYGYITDSSNNLDDMEKQYKNYVKDLKTGKEIILKDLAKELPPIALSWVKISFDV